MGVDSTDEFRSVQLGWGLSEEIRSVNAVLFTPSIDLYEEATRCHESQCFLATAVMCRGAIESMLHTMKVWKKKGAQYHPVVNGREKNLRALIKWAQDNELLDGKFASQADEIREKGNLGAHIGQRIEAALLLNPLEVSKTRISKEESERILHETRDLLVKLANNWKNRLEESTNQPRFTRSSALAHEQYRL